MNRLGVLLALLVVAAIAILAMIVRVTGPGQRAPKPAPKIAVAPAGAAGPLLIPVQGVAAAALHDDWAEPRGDGTRTHHAIDIMAPTGTPVLAAADGRIEKLFDSKLGGTTIYERSPDGGTIYYYAHLDRYAPTLVEGMTVARGQVIAGVGATGDADPGAPHLHFEVHRMAPGQPWWQGEELNPYPMLVAR
jgi:murein DD-endopeptidase MepM/ murein hydrolase activator NlpD